jgi:hypothetical protein
MQLSEIYVAEKKDRLYEQSPVYGKFKYRSPERVPS